MNKGKYVVVGDVHGNYNALRDALKRSCFNPNTDTFVGLGDYFDRGNDNISVFNFLKTVPNKLLCVGNHDIYLYQCIKNKEFSYYDIRNQTAYTVCELAGYQKNLDSLFFCKDIFKKAEDTGICEFIEKNMRWYREIDSHYFTHGFLPLTESGNVADIDKCSDKRWMDACQGRSIHKISKFIEKYPNGIDKTIVVGHWASDLFRVDIDKNNKFSDTQNWTGEKWVDSTHKIVGLDSTTALTNFCDYLTIEK